MLSPETLETYRRMTPSERLRLTLELSRPAWAALTEGPEEVVAKRFERLREENDLRNQRIVEGLRRSERWLAERRQEAASQTAPRTQALLGNADREAPLPPH